MGDHIRVQFPVRDIYHGTVCNQPPGLTQPGHPFVGRRNEYQPKSGDALRLGVSWQGKIRVIPLLKLKKLKP